MAEPMKNHYGEEIPKRIAGMIHAVWPAFPERLFLRTALDGYLGLELMPRARKIADALRLHLPPDYEEAITLLVASLGSKLRGTGEFGLPVFIYLPHVFFVARYGLDHFELSMQAQYEITQRFTAEFSLRYFYERYPAATLERLHRWALDPSPHVRRLVSEGTRPRLPWAPRLRSLQKDPRPVLPLLEILRDDPELYVRRSVANHWNDIGKDHPRLLISTMENWITDAGPERKRLIRHALRSLIKEGRPEALALLGAKPTRRITLEGWKAMPARPHTGDTVRLEVTLRNLNSKPVFLVVDLRIHFIKANGSTSPKVFKLKEVTCEPHEALILSKTISFQVMTTRRPFPGDHRLELLVNGSIIPLGSIYLAG